MSYDAGLAQILRDALAAETDITEKKMFGGLAFMLHGNLVCGVHKGGAMFRVGKKNEAQAKAVDGARDMMFTGRRMGGLIDVADEALAENEKRAFWLGLALQNARSLPPK